MSTSTQPEQQNKIICFAGRKGSGKSTKAREVMEQCTRLCLYDTMGEHLWVPDRFTEIDQAEIYLMESHTHETFQMSYTPEEDDEEKDFTELCNTVFNQGNMMFGIEEVVMLGCSPNFAPKKFKRLMRLGRHRNVDMLYTTQRFGECPRALTAATDYFVLFSCTEPRDLDHISERCGPDVARKVANFDIHDFLVWDVIGRREVSTIDAGFIIAEISSRTIPAAPIQ